MIRGAVLVLVLSGCAAIEPDAVLMQAGHQSSIAQHLQAQDPHVGSETLGLAARWQRGRWVGEVSEAHVVTGMTLCPRDCPHDVFNATIGYEIPLK